MRSPALNATEWVRSLQLLVEPTLLAMEPVVQVSVVAVGVVVPVP